MLNLAAIAFGAFAIAFFLRRGNKAPKVRAWLFAAAGAGMGGLIASLVYKVLRHLNHVGEVSTGKLTGSAMSGAVLFLIVLVVIFEVIDPKNKTPHKWADYAMFVLPFLLVLAGGSYAELVAHAQNGELQAGNGLLGTIGDFIRDF
jgi:drug/metabolite transporter (DMT)-like permease